jgi:hypothetical protein
MRVGETRQVGDADGEAMQKMDGDLKTGYAAPPKITIKILIIVQ